MDRTFTRSFLSRAAITLLLAVLTTATAWAQEIFPTTYDELMDAIRDASADEIIDLAGDIDMGSNTITIDKSITINLLGYQIYGDSNGDLIVVESGGTLTLFSAGGAISNSGSGGAIVNNGTLTFLNDVTLIGGLTNDGTLNAAATVEADDGYTYCLAVAFGLPGYILAPETATITLFKDGTIAAGIDLSSSADITLNLNGHTLTSEGSYAFNFYEDAGTLTIAGGGCLAGAITGSGTVNIASGLYLWNGSELLSGTIDKSDWTTKLCNKTLVSHVTYTDGNNVTQTTPIDWATQSTGNDADHAYMIYHPAQLLLLAYRVNGTHDETRQSDGYKDKYFRLGADIAFSYDPNEGDEDYAENYEAIGRCDDDDDYYFKGNFDGDGHTVSGIRLRKTGDGDADSYQALFGQISNGTNVHDVHLTDARIQGYDTVGGIVGWNFLGTVTGCTVTESVITATGTCGAICGIKYKGSTLSHNYYRHCTVNGTANATGVGCQGADIDDDTEGAMPMYVAYTAANGSTAKCFDYTELTGGAATTLTAGWYVVNSNVTVNGRINLTGDTNLILGDGYTLNVKGIYIPQGSTLTIYAQSDGETAGKIVSHPSDGAAIGGKSGYDNGNIVIYGGSIEATGAVHCAGIGSNDGQTGGTITIYGGAVTAKGGTDGAAIGGGRSCSGGTITIYGGTITANDPTASDICENGAGIGGGDCADGGTITINGGTITTYSRDGAGIGGGDDGDGGTITINGGTIASIKVNQGQGARIGGGGDAAPGTITINGGTITTEGGSGAGIGGGKRNAANGTVTINGGVIDASGSYGIGAGEEGADVAISLGWTSPDDRITASTYGGTVTIADGKSFHNGSEVLEPGTVADMDKLNGKTLIGVDVLQDDAANDVAALATRLGGKQTNIALSGRKLWKDGAWNTLVLPFAIADIETDGCPLNGATVRQLSEAYVTGTTLTLNFDAATTAIAAGTPYIVKWDGGTEGEYTENPVFQDVTVSTDTHDYDTQPLTDPGSDTYDATLLTDERVRFIGTYDQKTIDTEDRSILFLGAANTLYYPSGQSATTIGACRAYFKIGPDDAPAANARQLTAFNLTFGDENETTGISDATTMPPGGSQPPVWRGASGYTLDGRKLQGQPTRKGLYIHGGKKVVIK